MKRREAIAAFGTAATVGLAGCGSAGTSDSGAGSAEHEQYLNQMPWPKVDDLADGWKRTGALGEYLGETAGLDTYQKTLLFEDKAVRQNIKKKANGQFDQKLGQFFATYIDLEGLTTAAATASRIADNVEPQIKSRMESAGIKSVSSAKPRSPLPDVSEESRAFTGHYVTPRIEQTANIKGIGKKTVAFPSKQLPIRGFVSVWKIKSGVGFAAGGIVPDGDFEGLSRTSITSEEDDGIDLLVEVDMNIPYTQMRSEIVQMAESLTSGPSTL